MRILAVDVGTGTQDILVFDSSQTLENCVKMIMPSPTAIAAKRIREATSRGRPVVLSGFNMGGGPCRWSLEEHLRASLAAYATARAARTFDDDLSQVKAMGVKIVSEEETSAIDGEHVLLADVDMGAIRRALCAFDVSADLDGVAIAVLDHGEAPPGVSDRIFRFEHIRRVISEKRSLFGFAYLSDELPAYLTRMRDIAEQVGEAGPLLLLDTGPAAAIGALDDPLVAANRGVMVANTGNMHTMAVHMQGNELLGLFEHHTGALNGEQLEGYLTRLAHGTLTHEEIFDSEGHGCYILNPGAGTGTPFLALTGPQRGRFDSMAWTPYMAVPHGDMMIAGCFGLLRAFADRKSEWREEIEKSLSVIDR